MKKLYYSIGEVSDITDIEPHVLRYWESVFSALSPRKNKGGNRVYKEDDVRTIMKLKKLIKEKKYSTKGARQVLNGEEKFQFDDHKLPISLQKDLKEVRLFLNKLLKKI